MAVMAGRRRRIVDGRRVGRVGRRKRPSVVMMLVDRLVTLALPPRREPRGDRLPDFDYATNVRAAGGLYHTGAVSKERKRYNIKV